MKGLKTLIKLRKRELDTLQRQLAEQFSTLDKLKAFEEALKDELAREQAMAAEFPDMARFFGDFAKGIEKKREQNRQIMQQVERKIDAIREKITDAFSELKRLEITQEMMDKRAADKRRKDEDKQLDEIGLQQFDRRRQDPQQ